MTAQLKKKKSKRVSTRKRTKIERKVREHHRKLNKEAKKNPKKTFRKKDPGVPSNCPFKEQVLQEAAKHKEELDKEREKQKTRQRKQRKIAMEKKRNLGDLMKDAEKRSAEFERKAAFVTETSKVYTGGKAVETSLKAYYKEFRKVVEAADVVIEVLDARDPLGSRCPQVEEAVLACGAQKRLLLLLNKIDLIPKENAEKWLTYLRNEFPVLPFKASTQDQSSNLSRSKVPVHFASEELKKSSTCLGAEMLVKLLANYCRNKGIKTSIRVGIVGFPNTGKSSVINSLKRSKACGTGSTPGVTKSMQEVQLDKNIQLLDSPGIVMATGLSDAHTILRNCVKVETIDDPVPPVTAILKRCPKQQIMLKYNVSDFSDANEFLALLAARQGRLKKGGVPDTVKAGKTVLQDWNNGKLRYYTHPPETHSTHLSAEIVSQMSREFDVDALMQEQQETLNELKQKAGAMDMLVTTEGPTQANMDDGEMEEEPEEEGEEEVMEEEVEQKEALAKTVVNPLKGRTRTASKKTDLKNKVNPEMQLKGNRQMNKDKKAEFKKMKKNRKKADKVAGQLSSALEGAFSGIGMDGKAAKGQDYNFAVDFK